MESQGPPHGEHRQAPALPDPGPWARLAPAGSRALAPGWAGCLQSPSWPAREDCSRADRARGAHSAAGCRPVMLQIRQARPLCSCCADARRTPPGSPGEARRTEGPRSLLSPGLNPAAAHAAVRPQKACSRPAAAPPPALAGWDRETDRRPGSCRWPLASPSPASTAHEDARGSRPALRVTALLAEARRAALCP